MLLKLAWASVWHRKMRAFLSILAVAIGIAMMVTMLSLAHGTLGEVADRMTSVEAELIVLPSQITLAKGGADFNEKYQRLIEQAELDGRPVVDRVIPVLWADFAMAGQNQRAFAIDPADMPVFLGHRRLLEGRLPDADGGFRRVIDALREPDGKYDASAVTPEQLDQGAEIVIDRRLAAAGGYKVGDIVLTAGREWRIVGIIEPGVAARVFCPIQVLRHIKFDGLAFSTLFYVKLKPAFGQDPMVIDRIARAIAERTKTHVEPVDSIGQMLADIFAQMYAYIYVASAVAMTVCLLLICVTMYTLVVERTGQIAVLKAMGAGRLLLLGQSLLEATILSVAGTAAGLLLALLAKQVIESLMPLLTVRIEPMWIILALVVGIVGGALSSLYPGWRAGKVEPALALQSS